MGLSPFLESHIFETASVTKVRQTGPQPHGSIQKKLEFPLDLCR